MKSLTILIALMFAGCGFNGQLDDNVLLDLGFFEGSYEPLDYNPYAYVDPADRWAAENDPFDKTGVYEDSWAEP